MHQSAEEPLKCPVAMGKKGILFWLLHFKGEPVPKKRNKGYHWATGAIWGVALNGSRAQWSGVPPAQKKKKLCTSEATKDMRLVTKSLTEKGDFC